MKFKTVGNLMCLVVILSLLMIGCAQQAAPPAEEAPAEEAPAEEAPAAEQAPAEKLCTGVDIVYFPGGPPGGPFAEFIRNDKK